MSKSVFVTLLLVLTSIVSCEEGPKRRYLADSNGNMNHLTVVMEESDWSGELGKTTRKLLEAPYEGLPLIEPQFSLKHLSPKVFSGFARNSRNVLWFQKDTIARFQLIENYFARPQIVAIVKGEDREVQAVFVEENIRLLRATLSENEQKEKLRRIQKSPSKDKELSDRFKVRLVYPTAYKTVKDTTNFIWIQKPVQKGHLNIIAYSLPENELIGNTKKKIIEIRDSIGKVYVPGRLKGSFMITEKAYRPYFYKTKLDNKFSYLTKGTWEVENDFMAGPFVNYMIKDTVNKRWMVLEGFSFAPSISKRDYMFELNTILSSIRFE